MKSKYVKWGFSVHWLHREDIYKVYIIKCGQLAWVSVYTVYIIKKYLFDFTVILIKLASL